MVTKPTKEDLQVLELLRQRRSRQQSLKADNTSTADASTQLTLGQRISDRVAIAVGSWQFIILQTILIAVWIICNQIFGPKPWDPYPFIFLNLILSFQAAYTAPVIMMSQNRLTDIDRQRARGNFEISVKSDIEIELLHQKIDMLREKELLALAKAVETLSRKLESYNQ
jgi:uncharacterized membrane protein